MSDAEMVPATDEDRKAAWPYAPSPQDAVDIRNGLADNLPCVQAFARHRVATLDQRLRDSREIMPAIEIWFFRDLGETQRRQLFNLCGFPGAEATGHALQLTLLHQILATAIRSLKEGASHVG